VLTQTVKETRTICGGGCTEVLMAQAVDNMVPTIAGKKALAMEAFARALRQMPTIVADNGGYDAAQVSERSERALMKTRAIVIPRNGYSHPQPLN